ncbi:MAG TPA: type II toxin-antitoxin system VapC family toxin [Silvibacterium sp.]|nr:type II toxin-antitoxin system VapC family toxin [Silvibacterium sp.]
MRILLDTHVLLWAVLTPNQLSRSASMAVSDPVNAILVSAASAWEIATKVRLGKLPGAVALERRFMDAIDDAGYGLLSIDVPTALRAGRLIGDHGDPFDRMIVAQALALDIPIVSSDTHLDSFGVRRIW